MHKQFLDLSFGNFSRSSVYSRMSFRSIIVSRKRDDEEPSKFFPKKLITNPSFNENDERFSSKLRRIIIEMRRRFGKQTEQKFKGASPCRRSVEPSPEQLNASLGLGETLHCALVPNILKITSVTFYVILSNGSYGKS